MGLFPIPDPSLFFSNQVPIVQGHCFNALMNNNFIITSTVCIKRTIFDKDLHDQLKMKTLALMPIYFKQKDKNE